MASISPAADIVPTLVTGSIGVAAAVSGWGIYVGFLPGSPHTAIAIYDAPGETPNPKFALDYPAIQVTVRGTPDGYAAAFTKARAIKDLLLGMNPVTIEGVIWAGVNMLGDINSIGRDETNRPLLTMNFALILNPPATANRESL